MYTRFVREQPTHIVEYLQYRNKININPWKYTSYKIHEGRLSHIAIIDFTRITPMGSESSPFIVDINDYFGYYRKLKINLLKSKMI